MVQILPQKTNLGSSLGQSLGQGLQTGIQKGAEVGFNRNLLQQALGGIKDIAKNPNATPFDLATSLMSATAGIPGAEKYVGTLFEHLLPTLKARQLGNVQQPGEPQTPQGQQVASDNLPTTNQTSGKAASNLPAPSFTPDLFKGTLEPTELGLGPIPKIYTPDQIKDAEQKDLASGFKDSPSAKLMNEYNNNARNQIQDMIKGAQAHADISQNVAERQKDFRNILKDQLGLADPSDLAVAETISQRPEFKNIANDKIRAERVAKEVNLYQAGKDEFTRGSNRPNPVVFNHKYNTALDTLGNKAKDLIQYGQRDKAIETLAKNGWSESEIARILNPLARNTEQEINKLPVLRSEIPLSLNGTVNRKEAAEQKMGLEKWKSFLERNIKPGEFDPKNADVFKPGNSLILLRNSALKNRMGGVKFDSMVNELLNEGKIKLDPYQKRELQTLSQDPTRAWSLYEVLFGGVSP